MHRQYRLTFIVALFVSSLLGGTACDPDPEGTLEQCIRSTGVGPTAPGAAREFNCAGTPERFLVAIPPACTDGGCGLIADLPGATAMAENPNLNTGLRQRTRNLPQPFIVLGANNPRLFFDAASSDRIFEFMQALANVFDVDRDRIHIGGFSNGGRVTFDFACDPEKAAFIASAAPQATSQSIDGPVCARPLVPIRYFNGRNDGIADFPEIQVTAARIVQGIGAGAPETVDSSPVGNFVQLRFTGAQGQLFERLIYDNIKDPAAGPPDIGGHCYVGPFTPNGGACTDEAAFENGAKTLEFYLENPRRP